MGLHFQDQHNIKYVIFLENGTKTIAPHCINHFGDDDIILRQSE